MVGTRSFVFQRDLREDLRRIADKPIRESRNRFPKTSPSKRALPDHRDPPTSQKEGSVVPVVPGHRGDKLGRPELRVTLRYRGVLATVMTVPEAPVDEADRSMLGKNEIWPPWKALAVESIAKTTGVQGFPQ